VLSLVDANTIYTLKCKAMSVTGRRDPWGCEMLRIPHCLDSWVSDDFKVVSLTLRLPFYSLEKLVLYFWYSFLLEVEYIPGPSVVGMIRLIDKNHSPHQFSKLRPSDL
jgi:hypothetical protein